MEDFSVCHAKHKKHAVQNMIIFSYYIYISPFSSCFILLLPRKLEWKGICLFSSKTHLSLLSFSTPEFTHLSHHDNYLHGNHSGHHRHNVTAGETRTTETLLEAYGLYDLRDSKARAKGILSWDFNRKVILEIYSCILISIGLQSFLLPRSLWTWSKGHDIFKMAPQYLYPKTN